MVDIEITERDEQPTAVVRAVVPLTDLTDFFGRSYAAVAAALAEQDCRIAGPPFAKYYGMPTDRIDIEAGFPVAGPFASAGAVQPGSLPGGRCYEAMHTGPYDTLEETYNAILEQIGRDGGTPGEVMWEHYLTDPDTEPDPSKWQTQVCWPALP